MKRVHLTSTLAGLLLPTLLLAGSPGATAAPGDLPGDSPAEPPVETPVEQPEGDRGTWSVSATGADTWTVSWRAPERLPVTADRPSIVAADAGAPVPVGSPLGVPTVAGDGRTVEVTVTSTVVPAPDSLDVVLSGELLDEGTSWGAEQPTTPQRWEEPDRTLLPVDPGKAGELETVSSDYELAGIEVPGWDADVEMVGHVVKPAPAVEDAAHPLVLFLHGRHSYCYNPENGRIGWRWPCAGKQQPIPSQLGYDYVQQLLASQGYVTVSIAANGINAQDDQATDGGAAARSQLVRAHLDEWSEWAAGPEPEHQVDLDKVVLVGHSRGGEGVSRASLEIPLSAAYTVVGQVLIGPTNFSRQTTPYVPTVTVLPSCDGDVMDLQGQAYTDLARGLADGDTAMKSSIMSVGANHNFFNTEWTPGRAAAPAWDDWDAEQGPCGHRAETRLSAAEQRRVGKAYIAGAVHLFADGEQEYAPMFDGSATRVGSTRDAVVLSHMLGGDREPLVPGSDAGLTTASGAETALCNGTTPWRRTPKPLCGRFARSPEATPHWPTQGSAMPTSRAFEMAWEAGNGSGGLQLDDALDLSGSDWLDLRTVVDPKVGDVTVQLRITDADDASVTVEPVGGPALPAMPTGDRWTIGKYWAQTLRVDTTDLTGIDTSRISAVELVGTSDRGRVWVLDVAAASATLPAVPAERVPVLDLGKVRVDEGGDGNHVAEVPYTITGEVTRPAAFAVYGLEEFTEDGRAIRHDVTIPAGSGSGSFDWEYDGDTLDDYPRMVHQLVGHAVHDIMLRDNQGRVVIVDDDPEPELTFDAVRPRANEGGVARFEVTLSTPSGRDIGVWVPMVRGDRGTAPLQTHDVPTTWLQRWTGWQKGTDPALHELEGGPWVRVRQGRTSAVVRIPIRDDSRTEPRESLTVRAFTDAGWRSSPVTVHVPAND